MSVKKRDELLEIEKEVRKWWDESRVFEADQIPEKLDKFFGTFPFPYMNGFLHLGHAYSLSKVEFAAAYHRLTGKNVLLPFAFHGTGMPIKASADKLRREIEKFGNPPTFVSPETVIEHKTRPGNFKGKKSKTVSKTGKETYVWDIMRSYGLSDSEITKFQDPVEWLRFFPPLAVEVLKAFGLGCDWRRSFITTDANPYFDKFVSWQMRKLKAMGKIVKDLRYTIYSPLDGQPCADHDRAAGEGVIPQEYTLIKMEVVPPFPAKLAVLEGKKVYLAAATLRPETMYGQTNAWVLPQGSYGAYEMKGKSEVFILTERAARNLAYQRLTRVPETVTCLVELTGQDLIGLPIRSPMSVNEVIYCLPMLSVVTDKGTGIVTSVPSDSPDDFMALQDLKSKAPFKAKFGIKDEWLLPFDVISHPEFGDKTEGTMIVGEYKGLKIEEAKNLIRNKLVEAGQAVVYYEPEKKVVSRSGDECVVALTDQWYITYGESSWREEAEECLAGMNLYSDETRHGFEHTLTWLNQWACSRSFGLGTRIPWDEQFLVESLSDSTIYTAYYTIAHLLQKDLFGADTSCSVKPEQLTDDVWDYIFLAGEEPESSDIPLALLGKMRKEFEYWYPFDLRVSGKDLIQNHLAFCIYNHTAIFPKRQWPRGFRCNGHVTLDSQKMSKSTGNFMTLKEAIEEFSADATRLCLADAGDGMDDANFESAKANAAVMRLTKEKAWMEQVISVESASSGPPCSYADRVFVNEMNYAIKMTEKNYNNFRFREALRTGFYGLQAARNEYRMSCGSSGAMNRDLLWRFMDVQARLIAPICPHYAEHVWRKLLKKQGFVIKAGWPEADDPDLTLRKANKYLHNFVSRFRKCLAKQKKRPTVGLIYVKKEYSGWQSKCLEILRGNFDTENRKFAPEEDMLQQIPGGNLKQYMPFLKLKKDEVLEFGLEALDSKLPFDGVEVLKQHIELIKRQTGLAHVSILSVTDPADALPSPESPTFVFLTDDDLSDR